MTIYIFDNTLDGLLTAVFDSFLLKQQPDYLLTEGEQLPLFVDQQYHVVTDRSVGSVTGVYGTGFDVIKK